MDLLRSLAMALSCFSKVPVPQVEWKPESMRYMMCFFPVIGLVIGLVLALWWLICDALGASAVLRGAGLALLPIAITGGIHLDGFCDVVDAQSSHASPERKREILKDPHVGAFAVIGVGCYLIAYTALAIDFSSIAAVQTHLEVFPTVCVILLLGCLHILSRCASGLATVLFAQSGTQGMLAMFQQSAEKRPVAIALLAEFVVFAIVACFASPTAGVVMIIACAVCLAGLSIFARTQFGGMSGDLAGFFLQVAEVVMLACLVLIVHTVGL